MRVQVNHYCGAAMLNTLRQIALTRLPETRPIAFKVGAFSNVLAISDSVEEDMTEFISNVCSSVFSTAGSDEILVCSCTAEGKLSIDDLTASTAGGLTVVSKGAVDILHCTDRVGVYIVFRTAAGKFTRQENAEFLRRNGIDSSSYVTVNSRHTPTAEFAIEKVAELGELDEYEIGIFAKAGLPVATIYDDAVRIYKDDAMQLKI